jgi:hypothetical protein
MPTFDATGVAVESNAKVSGFQLDFGHLRRSSMVIGFEEAAKRVVR